MQLRQLGLVLFTCWVVLVVVALALAELHPATWVDAVVIGVIVLGSLASVMRWIWSARLEDRAYRRSREPVTAARSASRPTAREVIRATGPVYLVFFCLALLGLPLTLIGASVNVHWLLVLGLVLLALQLIDMAVIWPIKRARRSASK
jgi:membrane protein YqaA with SNARE-associated domain